MSLAEKIVGALLEDELDGEDTKEFMDRNSEGMLNQWEQIGGDFGDPWIYGGDWFNIFKSEVVHIDGLENNGIKDIDPDAIELTPEENAKIMADFPVLEDPEDPGAGDENERARDEAIWTIRSTRADEMTAAQTQKVYRFLDEEIGPDDWPKQEEIAAQFKEGTYEGLSTAQKWIEIGRYHGFEELDHYPEPFTKAKLSEYLGLKL